jgi:hypothetical protein
MGRTHQAKWYVRNGRTILGPLTSPEMRRLAREGIITADSLVGKGDGRHWAPATKVKGLFPTPGGASDAAAPASPPPPESSAPTVARDDDDSSYSLLLEPPPPPPGADDWAPAASEAPTALGGEDDFGYALQAAPPPDSEAPTALGDEDDFGYALQAAPPPDSEAPAALGSEDDFGYALPVEPPPDSEAPTAVGEDDSGYALRAEPPPLPSGADDAPMPLGYRRFVDDDREKKGPKRKWQPGFSFDLFGVTIDRGTLRAGGLLVGFIALTALTFALVAWWPRASQKVLEARTVTLVNVLRGAALVRDDRDGDTLLIKLRLSKRFLRESAGTRDGRSAEQDVAPVSHTDFHLASDNAETAARVFLTGEAKSSPWDTPVDIGNPRDIAPILPLLGENKVDVSGSLSSDPSGAGVGTGQGSVTASVSGAVQGQVTVTPILQSTTRARVMRSGAGGYSIVGRVEGKLPDGTPVSFDYTGDACKITWSGKWLGWSLGTGAFPAPLAERWYDKTVDAYCVFPRPRGASKLSVRYKDASPIDLSPSLAGPAK